jgi:A/G-specific adenine glycosylase
MEKFVKQLEKWYLLNRRDLPFRHNRYFYPVWVSEIMAQQTRIETMLPYYGRWMEKWPSITELALADERDVLKMWEGLGYYNRARNLYKGAKFIHNELLDIPPTTYSEILMIPGIGPYTAAAIASIVYDQKTAAIDGNVLRVVARLYRIESEISSSVAINIVQQAMDTWIADSTPHVFTQAMMELGAIVCTPQSPDCDACPVNLFCLAFQDGSPAKYPIKKAKAKVPVELFDCFILRDDQGKIALSDQADDGLMKGYFRFPVASQLQGLHMRDRKLIGVQKHVYSHKIWQTTYYAASIDKTDADLLWVSENELAQLPLIGAHRKFYLKQKPE